MFRTGYCCAIVASHIVIWLYGSVQHVHVAASRCVETGCIRCLCAGTPLQSRFPSCHRLSILIQCGEFCIPQWWPTLQWWLQDLCVKHIRLHALLGGFVTLMMPSDVAAALHCGRVKQQGHGHLMQPTRKWYRLQPTSDAVTLSLHTRRPVMFQQQQLICYKLKEPVWRVHVPLCTPDGTYVGNGDRYLV